MAFEYSNRSSLIANFDYSGPQQNLGPERQRPMGLAK